MSSKIVYVRFNRDREPDYDPQVVRDLSSHCITKVGAALKDCGTLEKSTTGRAMIMRAGALAASSVYLHALLESYRSTTHSEPDRAAMLAFMLRLFKEDLELMLLSTEEANNAESRDPE